MSKEQHGPLSGGVIGVDGRRQFEQALEGLRREDHRAFYDTLFKVLLGTGLPSIDPETEEETTVTPSANRHSRITDVEDSGSLVSKCLKKASLKRLKKGLLPADAFAENILTRDIASGKLANVTAGLAGIRGIKGIDDE